MRTLVLSWFVAFLFLITPCTSQENPTSQIAWDSCGVPHIYADNTDQLFFAQGWAQMHNHANMILELYGSSRGKGAEYWGKEKLQNDLLINTLQFDELADHWETIQDPELKAILYRFCKRVE